MRESREFSEIREGPFLSFSVASAQVRWHRPLDAERQHHGMAGVQPQRQRQRFGHGSVIPVNGLAWETIAEWSVHL